MFVVFQFTKKAKNLFFKESLTKAEREKFIVIKI